MIKITGKGLQLRECEHVITCNLEFGGGDGSHADAIEIKPKSRHIWIDRCSLSNYYNGLIDITREAQTLPSRACQKHGARPSHTCDRCMRVTIHHCFFSGTRQRHPWVRFARVHLYNNYSRNWGVSAVCSSVESQILSQGNIYEGGLKKIVNTYKTEKAGDKEQEASGCIRSEGDLLLGGAESGLGASTDAETDDCIKVKDLYPILYQPRAATESLKNVIRMSVGWQDVALPNDIAV